MHRGLKVKQCMKGYLDDERSMLAMCAIHTYVEYYIIYHIYTYMLLPSICLVDYM